MTRSHPLSPVTRVPALLLVVALAAGCSAADPPVASPDASSSPASSGAPSSGAPSSGAPSPSTSCEPGPGREVEELPDLTTAPVELPEGQGTLPAQVVDTGCVIRFDAPGGCLGAVTISAVEVPPLTIPGTEVDGREYPEVVVQGATAPEVSTPQVCQVTTEDEVPGVTRAGVVREGFSRDGAARPGDDVLPAVRVPPVRVPDVDVDPERLESRRLRGADVDVVGGSGATSYVAPANVLFAPERAELRPEAVGALRAIARQIRATAPGARLLVEGHTDDQGSAAFGLDLSRRRAATVARWLVRRAGVDRALVTERGWGEEKPAYDNATEQGRQRNRRVVITVLR